MEEHTNYESLIILSTLVHKSTPHLVEALQTLLDLSKRRVWDANFDFWVLPLGMQTISHNSGRITETKKGSRNALKHTHTNVKCTPVICFFLIVNMHVLLL